MDFEKLMKGAKGRKKGQAVMEYLITYGLALFVILIVLAILVAVVLPQLKAPESCQFTQPGFSCSTKQHVIVSNSNNGNVVTAIIQLDNQQSQDINVRGVLCTSDVPGNVNANTFSTDMAYVITPTTPNMNAGASAGMTLPCVDANGNVVILNPGSTFKGTIAVEYNYANEPTGQTIPARVAVATISGTAQAG